MLLVEWFAWYDAMPPLEASERLAAYTTHLLADSGWLELDRRSFLSAWERLASLAEPMLRSADGPVPADAAEGPSVREQARRVFSWLRSGFGEFAAGVTYG